MHFTQYGHNTCALFTFPHAEHLFNAVTSLIPLPAMNLCLFFMCDVFFFGTARSTDSHMSPSSDGIAAIDAKGIGILTEEGNGCCNLWRSGNVTADRNGALAAAGRMLSSGGSWRSAMVGGIKKTTRPETDF